MLETKNQSEKLDLLNSLQVAAPCNVSWESMEGNDRVRHCLQCKKNVYNISSMSGSETNQFLQATAQQACVRFYKRVDGTILLDNCPIGLRKLRAQYKKVAAIVTTIISFAQGWLLAVSADQPVDKTRNNAGCNTIPVNHSKFPGIVTMGRQVPPEKDPYSVSVQSYQNNIKPIISSSMPKNENLGKASLYIFVATDGSITKAELFNPSPSKKTDELILKAVKNLKLPPLPKDFHAAPLCVYYECHEYKDPFSAYTH